MGQSLGTAPDRMLINLAEPRLEALQVGVPKPFCIIPIFYTNTNYDIPCFYKRSSTKTECECPSNIFLVSFPQSFTGWSKKTDRNTTPHIYGG